MERWSGKIAVVTGASAGIGAAIALDLVKAGVVVVGLARRVDQIEELRTKLPASLACDLHALKCDVSKEQDIVAAFEWVERNLGGVDILVNNAGVLRKFQLIDMDNTKLLREVLDTNVIGLVQCTREAFQSMKARGVDGHVVLINSFAGHAIPVVPGVTDSMNIYPPSKHAVTAITEILRQEFNNQGTKIKISSISPGIVDTNIVPEPLKGKVPALNPEDISASVLHILGTPPHVQIHELIIKPLGEMF